MGQKDYSMYRREKVTASKMFSIRYVNIWELTPPEVPVMPPGNDDVPAVVLDPKETEVAFDWKARINFKETINRQLQWYDHYGVKDIFSHLTNPK